MGNWLIFLSWLLSILKALGPRIWENSQWKIITVEFEVGVVGSLSEVVVSYFSIFSRVPLRSFLISSMKVLFSSNFLLVKKIFSSNSKESTWRAPLIWPPKNKKLLRNPNALFIYHCIHNHNDNLLSNSSCRPLAHLSNQSTIKTISLTLLLKNLNLLFGVLLCLIRDFCYFCRLAKEKKLFQKMCFQSQESHENLALFDQQDRLFRQARLKWRFNLIF